MTKEELDFIGSMNMCDEISNEAYKKIVCHCEEQEPCEDCISRVEAIDIANRYYNRSNIVKKLQELPSVHPERKKGHWKPTVVRGEDSYICSECGAECCYMPTRFCPECGSYNGGEV